MDSTSFWRRTSSSTWSTPGTLISQARDVLAPTGTALFCVPNIAHWYPRFRSTLGMFDYDQRGILDSTHLRFFTRRSLTKLVERRGFAIRRIEPVGLPLDALGVDGTKARTSASRIACCRTCGPPCSATSSSSSRRLSGPDPTRTPYRRASVAKLCEIWAFQDRTASPSPADPTADPGFDPTCGAVERRAIAPR
jgi:hypothetical protein